MQLDPAFQLSLRVAFLALFGGALIHKLADFPRFTATVRSYVGTSAPATSAAGVLGLAVIAGEAAAVVSCIVATGRTCAITTAAMCWLYAAAMAINIRRGNSLLDCGCTWGRVRHPVGYELVVRNIVLGVCALLLLMPSVKRTMQPIDVGTVLSITLMAALLYASVNRLLTNAALGPGRSRWNLQS